MHNVNGRKIGNVT